MKIYDAFAAPGGSWGPWVVLDAIWNGSDKPYHLSIKSWQVDKAKAPYDGQLHWFQKNNDKEAHLTTFVGGYVDVDLAADSIQEPKIRFTSNSILPAIIRFTVNALIVLPSYDGVRPAVPLRREVIPSDKTPPIMEASQMARAKSLIEGG